MIAETLGVSPYHIHRISKLEEKDAKLKTLIEKTWKTHKAYGHIRLGLVVGIKTSQKLIYRIVGF